MLEKDKKKAPVGGFLVVPSLDRALKFYSNVFGAVEAERYQDPVGKVWYAVVHLFDLPLQLMEPFPSMGLYAPKVKARGATDSTMLTIKASDVDLIFKAAGRSRATALVDPQHDAHDGIRHAQFRDPFGHRWQVKVADTTAIEPVRVVAKLDNAVKFHRSVFSKTVDRFVHPRGNILHAVVNVSTEAPMRLMEPQPELGLVPAVKAARARDSSMVTLVVSNVDATFKKAIKAGGKPIVEPQDAYWGDRYAEFRGTDLQRYSTCGESSLLDEVVNPAKLQTKFQNFLDQHGTPSSPAAIVGVKLN